MKEKLTISNVVFFLTIGVFLCTTYIVILAATCPDVSYLKKENPKKSAMMKQREKEAEQKNKKYSVRHKWISFNLIPQLLKDTVMASEDFGFYHHEGIDFHEIYASMKKNIKKLRFARGGSTITQQLAKNLFLSTDKSIGRKIKEYFITKDLEEHLSKDRIFSLYLNIIEFGEGIFGIETAAQYFFGKSVPQLSLHEIVRLVAIMPKPLRVSPLSKSRYITWRASLILERLVYYDKISEDDYTRALAYFGGSRDVEKLEEDMAEILASYDDIVETEPESDPENQKESEQPEIMIEFETVYADDHEILEEDEAIPDVAPQNIATEDSIIDADSIIE